jgi:transcription elongation factor GreA
VENEVLVTREGYEKMIEDLEQLKSVKRQEISDRIRQAIEFGDISENSEYEDAKNEQAFVEGRIMSLEKKISNAKLIDESAIDTHHVSLGCHVTLEDMERKEKNEYIIVGSAEADPLKMKISNESPVGKAVLGKKPGQKITVTTPGGPVRYKVISITKA